MTGYGSAELQDERGKIVVELKSVNHRYLEVVPRLPRDWISMEEGLRNAILAYLKRGRVEVFVSFDPTPSFIQRSVQVDHALLYAAFELMKEASTAALVDFEAPSLGNLLAIPGLFTIHEHSLSFVELQPLFLEVVEQALQQLVAMRDREGQRLQIFLQGRADELQVLLETMKVYAPDAAQQYKERLARRLQESLANDLTLERIALEVAIIAERTSVAEELERLSSHLEQFSALLMYEEGATGRRMDFLLQEMNREINTIGSKSADLSMTAAVLAAKHTLEQMREQVQNIE